MSDSQEIKNIDEKEHDSELQNIIEAAFLASDEPVGIRRLMSMFPEDAQPPKVDVQNAILALQERCENRGVELKRIGKGWRYQSKEKYSSWLRKLNAQKPPRYSRALLETLAIIAYRQPVTRGDIEEIRGVSVSSDTIRTLEERDWVKQVGHRDVPGRPSLFGTTQGFLEYFNLQNLRELPELIDRRDLSEIAKEMNLTFPIDGLTEAGAAPQDASENSSDADQIAEDEQSSENDTSTGAEVIELHPDSRALSQEVTETNNSSTDEPDEDS
jgi:segregation and condensation protein B